MIDKPVHHPSRRQKNTYTKSILYYFGPRFSVKYNVKQNAMTALCLNDEHPRPQHVHDVHVKTFVKRPCNTYNE
jgi:hypothetical protein